MSRGGKPGGILNVEIIGANELITKFNKLADETLLTALHKAADKAADVVLSDAKSKAPRLTGAMAEGLTKLENNKGKKGVLVRVGSSAEANAAGQVRTSDERTVYYGILVEFGRPGVPAQPFMRPALDENQNKIQELFKEAIREAVENCGVGK